MSSNILLKYIQILRKKTGASIYTCKEALIKNKYNLYKSIIYIKNQDMTQKKIQNKKLYEGMILHQEILIGDYKLIFFIELNCETDFVSKNKLLLLAANKIIKFIINNKIFNTKKINIYLQNFLLKLTNKFDELIKINILNFLIHKNIYAYNHNRRILVIATYNINNDAIHNDVMKQIAMHIAAQKPKFITYKEIPTSIIKTYYEKELVSLTKSGKTNNLIKKIIYNKIKILQNELCLLKQNFIFDESILIEDILKQNKISINNYMYIQLCNNLIIKTNKNNN